MHEACLPPVTSLPLVDPLPEPWVLCVSNEIGFPGHFEEISLSLLPLAHFPSAPIGFVEIHPVVADPHLQRKSIFI
jgi:hypothetical protein